MALKFEQNLCRNEKYIEISKDRQEEIKRTRHDSHSEQQVGLLTNYFIFSNSHSKKQSRI